MALEGLRDGLGWGALALMLLAGLGGVPLLVRWARRAPFGVAQWVHLSFVLAVLFNVPVVYWSIKFGSDALTFSTSRDVDEKAPAARFELVETKSSMNLADLRGKLVVVNYWATWCDRCVESIPALNRLHREYASRGLVVLTVSDEPREKILRFIPSEPIGYLRGRLSPAEMKNWPQFQKGTRPTTVLIDPRGQVKRVLTGTRTFNELEREVLPFLQGRIDDRPSGEIRL